MINSIKGLLIIGPENDIKCFYFIIFQMNVAKNNFDFNTPTRKENGRSADTSFLQVIKSS